MKIPLSKAAKTWGVSRSTIYEKHKRGELTMVKGEGIDPIEMSRVFWNKRLDEKKSRLEKNDILENVETAILKQRIEFLEQQKKQYKKELKYERSRVDDLFKMYLKVLDSYLNLTAPKI